jgi:L-threonylcarbamoyladenylate synthase
LPTETVYGLAANADDDAAVAAIFAAKGRPADHPLIVHVADASAATHYAAEVPPAAQALMAAFWPGPLTLILPRRAGVAAAAAGGQPSVGLRCPAHPVAQALLHTLNNRGQIPINSTFDGTPKQSVSDPNCLDYLVWGLAAPSANAFGRVSPTTAAHVHDEFGDALLILDGGACAVGIESTIVDCTRAQPVLLRPGAITPAQIATVCGLQVLQKEELPAQFGQGPKASGTLESHYAPRAQVRLLSPADLADHARPPGLPADAAVGVWSPAAPAWLRAGQDVYRPMPATAQATAHALFSVLRALDDAGVAHIAVATPPLGQDWDGVRDRLQRAAHRTSG